MHDLALKQGPSLCRATLREDWQISDELLEFVGEAVSYDVLVHAFPLAGDSTLISLAQPGGSLDECIQYRFEIERRAAYGLEHVGGGGLLLKRFPQLLEQPGVLDSDDGLSSEVRQQRNLLVGERSHLLAVNNGSADQFVVLEHWHGGNRPRTTQFDEVSQRLITFSVTLLCRDIGDVCNLPRPHNMLHGTSRSDAEERLASAFIGKRGGTSCVATVRKPSPSDRYSIPNLAPQIRTAFSNMA